MQLLSKEGVKVLTYRKALLRSFMVAALSFMVFSQAWAHFPERRIQIINPWAPGDSEDIIMRKAAKHMSVELGVPVRVINRTGSGGAVGGATMIDSMPDGYTLGILTQGPAIINILTGKSLYGIEDYQPVGLYLDYSFVLAARADAPYSTIQELARYVQQGNRVVLGTFDEMSAPALISRLIAEREGFEFSDIVSLDPVTPAALVDSNVDVITIADGNNVRQGSGIKILISLTNSQICLSSDTPNIQNSYNMDVVYWAGLFAPKGTPDEAMQVLTRAFKNALQKDDIIGFAKSTGTNVYFIDVDESKDRITEDFQFFKTIIDRFF